MPIKPLKRIIKGRRLTATELGYERNPKTGRLEKPGTKRFNEKVAFQEDHNNALLDLYRQKIKENPTDINKQKLVDREIQLTRKLTDIKRQRAHDLAVAERNRFLSLKRRQLKYKVSRINSLLSVANKGKVGIFLENLIDDVHKYKVRKAAENQKNKLLKKVPSLFEVSREITREFYNEFDKAVMPTELKDMNSRDAVILVDGICKRIKRRAFI